MKKRNQRGIVQLIVLILIAILALSYFGIDLEQAFSKPLLAKNLSFTWNKTVEIWNNYIYGPISGILGKDDSPESESGNADGITNE